MMVMVSMAAIDAQGNFSSKSIYWYFKTSTKKASINSSNLVSFFSTQTTLLLSNSKLKITSSPRPTIPLARCMKRAGSILQVKSDPMPIRSREIMQTNAMPSLCKKGKWKTSFCLTKTTSDGGPTSPTLFLSLPGCSFPSTLLQKTRPTLNSTHPFSFLATGSNANPCLTTWRKDSLL